MAAPTFAPALGLVDAAGVPISVSNPLSVSLVAGGGGTAVSIADGADVTQGSLADSSSALTVNGLLKAIKALLVAPLAVTGSFYQATQPVSGTVTANAGTGTFAVSVSGLLLSQGSTTSGQTGPLLQGAVTTAAPSYTTAQTAPLSLTTGGALRVNAAQLPTALGQQSLANSVSVGMNSGQVGTAGAGSTAVFTVQGNASGTALPVSGTVTATQGTAAAASSPWSAQLSDGAAAYTAAKTGQLPTSLGIKSAGQALGVAVQQDNYTTVLTGTTAGTQVFNGACCVRQVVILTGATSAVVSISDGSGSAGTAWDIDASSRGVINLNVKMFFGIWVVISGGSPKVLITKD